VQRWRVDVVSNFETVRDLNYDNLFQLATLVSRDREVVEAFEVGRKAVQEEGLSPDDPKVLRARQELFARVSGKWQALQKVSAARQLHFHLGPGSQSFLRVHKPAKFGDVMTDLRHTIVHTNSTGGVALGFETGRVYSGFRAVVPLMLEGEQVGALETGSGFEDLLKRIRPQYGDDIVVVLKQEHVHSTMWAHAVESHFGADDRLSYGFVETNLGGGKALLTSFGNRRPEPKTNAPAVEIEGKHWAVASAPIVDFQAYRTGSGAPVGWVFFFKDASAWHHAYVTGASRTYLWAGLAYVVILPLIYLLTWRSTQALEQQVAKRTQRIQRLLDTARRLAKHDQLTGLPNRRSIKDFLDFCLSESAASGTPLTIALIDVDFLRIVNDSFGHHTGDRVLRAVADTLDEGIEEPGRVGRFGGEEFLAVFPERSMDGVLKCAKTLNERVADLSVLDPETEQEVITSVSIGLVELSPDEQAYELVSKADYALHQAKKAGRNRAVVYQRNDALDGGFFDSQAG
jgi:diguanylate cyclase (GGDEF)-like protein